MFETGLFKTLLAVIFILLIIALVKCSTAKKNVKTVSCSDDSLLVLTVEKEFVELSYQDVYNLSFRNKDGKLRPVTGNIHILPEAKRYRDMITVRDYTPGTAKSLFNYHYLFPSDYTLEEFNLICDCYGRNRTSFPEIENKIGALVYGDYNLFNEIFKLPDGFFIMTENNGNLTILTDPSPIARTLPAEKKHFNNIGYFDGSNRLHLRRGKIISDVFSGFYGKPVKQVEFITEDGKVDYTGEIETIWCDILYNSEKTGVNSVYLLSAVNDNGERLDKVFSWREQRP
jgi:hypothetical protein